MRKKYYFDKNNFVNSYYYVTEKSKILEPVFSKSWILSIISFLINIFNIIIPIFTFFTFDIFFKTKNSNFLNKILIICLLVIIINYILHNIRWKIINTLKSLIDDQIFNNLMDKLFSLPNSKAETKQESFWLSLFNDIDVMKGTINAGLFSKQSDMLFIAISIGIISGLFPHLAHIVIPTLFIYLLVIYFFYKKVFSVSEKENISISTRTSLIVSSIKNLSSIKSGILKDKIKSSWKDYQKNVDFKLSQTQSLMHNFICIFNVLSSCCLVLLIYFMGNGVVDNKISIGEGIFIIFTVMALFNLFNSIISSYPDYLRFNRSVSRLNNLLLQISHNKQNTNIKGPITSVLKTESIFVSDNRGGTIINNLDMELHPGTLYIIKCKSPSLSSIVLKCLAGLYPIENGNIMISGYNIDKININAISNYVRYINDIPVLFYGSIKENITCFYDKNLQSDNLLKLEYLLSVFHLDSTLENLPQGYNTIIDNNSTILSSEEIKLINIIRGLIGNPSIILLDNPFTSLSSDNRQKLIELLINISKKKLVIITSSSYDSYIDNSHIIQIKDGEVEIKENDLVKNNHNKRSLFKRLSIH